MNFYFEYFYKIYNVIKLIYKLQGCILGRKGKLRQNTISLRMREEKFAIVFNEIYSLYVAEKETSKPVLYF